MKMSKSIAFLAPLLLIGAMADAQSRPDRSTPSKSGTGTAVPSAPQSAAIIQGAGGAGIKSLEALVKKLNKHNTVSGMEENKSYPVLFDAYFDLTDPPYPIGPDFNQATIHGAMPTWSVVSGWAESNSHMVDAIIAARDKQIVGLPYGRNEPPAKYVDKGIFIELARGGKLGNIDFNYFEALETISAFATAEIYRRFEAGQSADALELALAHIFVLRQFCDRDFLAEKTRSIAMLSTALQNLRDMFYVYQSRITPEQYRDIAIRELPFLRPDRNRLLMPEADRHVSETRIRLVFDERSSTADPEAFANTFSSIQSKDAPLTAFGAHRRWEMIALVHGSLEASVSRLSLIYDDWWRRWRVEAYDPILFIPTEFSRCNSVRYAAVLYSLQDIASLFGIRNQLIAEVNGTAMAAGLCGHRQTFESYPREQSMVYAVFTRKRSDIDPHDFELGEFKCRLINSRRSIDTNSGRLWLERGEVLLYSLGQNNADDQAETHTTDGSLGDVVLWPPIKALQREQDLID